MPSVSSPTIWLSGSEHHTDFAHECRAALAVLGVSILSQQELLPGDHVVAKTEAGIAQATGIVVLSSPRWTAATCPTEGPSIVARCLSGGLLWIVDVASTSQPPEFKVHGDAQRSFRRLPGRGKVLAQLPAHETPAVWEELCRSVAIRFGLPAPQDAQYSQLQAYRQSQYSILENLTLRGFFGAQHVANASSFRLAELFVSPRLAWLHLPTSFDQEYRKFSALIVDPKLTPSERWHWTQKRDELVAKYKSQDFQTIDEAQSNFPQIMLLGKPGTGKSSVLHHLELQAHQSDSLLAVQIRLQNIADEVKYGETLWPHVLQRICSQHGPAIASAFEERVYEGRALLLLDGVDEVSKQHRAKLLSAVEHMLLARPTLRCVVTSRLADDCCLDRKIPHLQLSELNKSEIALFVRQHKRCENFATAEAQTEKFLKALASRSELETLAHNPLSLRLLCLLDHGREGMPMRLVELYDKAIHTLLKTWPPTRVIRNLEIPADSLRQALADAAAWMHKKGQREATRDDLVHQLGRALSSSPPKTAEQLATYCLDEATEHFGILVESSQDRFEFLHLTFTEYLAAEHYVRTNRLAELIAQREDVRYLQVICFAAGILARVKNRSDDAAEFVRQLIAESPDSIDRVLHPYVSLAVACVGDGHGFPAALIDELLCALLRAATIPLRTLTDSAEKALRNLHVPASAQVINSCSVLLHHPLDSLRRSVTRWLSQNAIGHPAAQDLFLQFLTDRDDVVAGQAALGLLRAQWLPKDRLFLLLVRLAACFELGIDSADEVESFLRRDPCLVEEIEKIYRSDDSGFREQAARLLSLLRPDDWNLLSLLLDKGGDVAKQALCRAVRHSATSAQRMVDHFVANARPRTDPRPTSEPVLLSVFADTDAVRQRLLWHFCRPLPEIDGYPWEKDPERRYTEAADTFLQAVARVGVGEERLPSQVALLTDLSNLLPLADGALGRRIAALGLTVGAPVDWLTQGLIHCLQAGGLYRVWAIHTAYQHQLYKLAVSGTLARAETPGCFAAAVMNLRRRLHRGSSDRQILSVLTQLDNVSHGHELILLGQVAVGEQSVDNLYPLLAESPGSRPLPLSFWAASEIVLQARRDNKQPPVFLLGAILALACVQWRAPPDLQIGAEKKTPRRTWIPSDDSHFDHILWADNLEVLQINRTPEEAAGFIVQFLNWLRSLAGDGAELHWVLLERQSLLIQEAMLAYPVALDELLRDFDHPNKSFRTVADWVLKHLCHSTKARSRKQDESSYQPSNASQLIYERIFHLVAQAKPARRWRLTEFLYQWGMGGSHLQAALVSFLSAEFELQVRYAALRMLDRKQVLPSREVEAVICAALAADSPDLRLSAVELALELGVTCAPYTEALRPLLALASTPEIRLEAAAVWFLVPGADRSIIIPALVDLLETMDPTRRRTAHRVRAAHRHLVGPLPPDQPITIPQSAFEPRTEKAGVGLWSAALLAELGDHEDELRTAAAAWLDALPSKVNDQEPWDERRHLALSLLEHLGVGSAGPAVDRALLHMLEEEPEHPTNTFHWMKNLERLSQPLLQSIIPFMLRFYWDLDKKIYDWVMDFVQQDSVVQHDFEAALLDMVSKGDQPTRGLRWRLIELLLASSLVDETVARFFAVAATQDAPRQTTQELRRINPATNPLIRQHLIAALVSSPPYESLNLLDWLAPFSELTKEDGSPPASLPPDSVAALRMLLSHSDLWLRIEAAERLCLVGIKDPSVIQALQSGLHAPHEWVGHWFGDDARRQAARILWQFNAISPQEILDALLPLLTSAQSLSNLEPTIEFLGSIDSCCEPMLKRMAQVLTTMSASRFDSWSSLILLFRFGFPEGDRIAILLRYVAEFAYHSEEVVKELRKLLPDIDDATPGNCVPSDSLTNTSERNRRLKFGPLGGAAELAELPRWPAELLRQFTAALTSTESILCELEENKLTLERSKGVELLEPLLHHRAGDSSLTRLVRHACLLRFGKRVGITLEQIPYDLTG